MFIKSFLSNIPGLFFINTCAINGFNLWNLFGIIAFLPFFYIMALGIACMTFYFMIQSSTKNKYKSKKYNSIKASIPTIDHKSVILIERI